MRQILRQAARLSRERTTTQATYARLTTLLLLIVVGIAAPTVSYPRQAGLSSATRVCLSDGPPDIVISACTRLLDLNRYRGGTLSNLLNARGYAYLKASNYDRAIADFNEMLQIFPNNAAVYYMLGETYQAQGDLKSALAALLEYRRRAPNIPEASAALARVQQQLADPAQQTRQLFGKDKAEIKALQQRLTDEGCYQGPIDGEPNASFPEAVKACPVQDPMLRIETETHTARIRGMDADAQCRMLATTGDDKTIRIWSAADGHLLRTLRWPIDPAVGGTGYAVALSPDGKFVAAAGWDAQADVTHQNFIYVFDAATGAIVTRQYGFSDAIKGLAYSSDGHWLAATGGNLQAGVRVLDTTDWRPAMSDLSYQRPVYAVTFGPDGALYTASWDFKVRRYGPGPSFVEEREVATPRGDGAPMTISADPRGEFVVVGFFGSRAAVSFFDATTLRYRFGADTRGIGSSVASVGWSNDGTRLLAGGVYGFQDKGSWRYPLFTFDRDGRRSDAPTPTTDDSIFGVKACRTGMALISGSGFGVVDQAGTLSWRPSAAVDMRDRIGDAFTIAPDAKQVRFGLEFVEPRSWIDIPVVDPVTFDLSRGTLSASPQVAPGFVAPITTTLPVDHWYNQAPVYAGKPLSMRDNETSHALAIRPESDGFVIGAAFTLRGLASDGLERWELLSATDVWGVNLSADGSIVVAAVGDGTIRWHRWSDGKELLALFVDQADKRWVAWTPSGYYMASPGGEDLIGWNVNRGWDQAADYFPASRFRARFNRPDIVRLVLDTLDEEQAIKQANAAAGRKEDTQPLIGQLPPLIRIVDPAPGTHVASGAATIGYSFRSPSGLPVDRIVVDVNGRPVKEIALPVRALSGDQETTGTVALTLGTRESDVGLIAWSGDLASQVAHVTITWDGAPATTSAMRKLHVLVAGVSAYADPNMRLDFAAKDAADFAKALEAQKGIYYGDVETRVLTDAEVTRGSLTQGLDWLKTVATGPDDVSILFLAGHGLTDAKGTYWFFPADANADDMDRKGVSQEEIRQSLQGLKGKVLWFLDTCHAGAAATRAPADMNVLLNTVTAAENGGIVVFASSSGTQVSIESKDLGNGAFTKALVEGIEQGKAAFLHDLVTTSSLDGFVESRVKELTGDKQTPVMERPPQEPDFTIAQAPR